MPVGRHTAESGMEGVAAFAGARVSADMFHTVADSARCFFEIPMPSETDKFCSDGI
ncbi:TPA: hypothetical protein WH770_000496 [Neisseria meningitidis]|uniref:hypothetical protein n=1 Tax=Neisseria lactamica TaxID=486 RepID=UPI0013B363C0|nr:hypothetical protein [Neisseria lactamica]